MRKELDEKLCADFPIIFKDRHEPMNKTAMCWGFDCGDGWYNLIREVCEKLSKLEIVPTATQVKEKYGGLRFYIYNGSEEAYDIIGEAELKSETICETCGNPGVLHTRGWMYTACPEHTKE